MRRMRTRHGPWAFFAVCMLIIGGLLVAPQISMGAANSDFQAYTILAKVPPATDQLALKTFNDDSNTPVAIIDPRPEFQIAAAMLSPQRATLQNTFISSAHGNDMVLAPQPQTALIGGFQAPFDITASSKDDLLTDAMGGSYRVHRLLVFTLASDQMISGAHNTGGVVFLAT